MLSREIILSIKDNKSISEDQIGKQLAFFEQLKNANLNMNNNNLNVNDNNDVYHFTLEEGKEYVCPRCGYSVMRKTDFSRHIERKIICPALKSDIRFTPNVIKQIMERKYLI